MAACSALTANTSTIHPVVDYRVKCYFDFYFRRSRMPKENGKYRRKKRSVIDAPRPPDKTGGKFGERMVNGSSRIGRAAFVF